MPDKFQTWWNDHPFFKQFYVPMVLTATFIVTVVDAFNGNGGHGK